MYDFSHDTRCTPDPDVFVAHRAVLVENQPVFNAALTEQLVAIITLLGISCYF